MGQADWTQFVGSLDKAIIDFGVTSGITPPDGGGSFVFGWNSLQVPPAPYAVGYFASMVDFAPHAKGCRISLALKRHASGGTTGFSVYGVACAQGPDIDDKAYLIGLSDSDPSYIVLGKASIAAGLQASGITVLAKSVETVPIGEWVHLQLEVVVNANDDVILKVRKNDLDSNPVTAPVWATIAGMEDYTDDALGIASGTQPFTSGRSGFAFHATDTTRRGAVDHFAIARQV